VVELLTDARLYSLPRHEADLVFRIQPFDEPGGIARRLVHSSYGVYLKKRLVPPGLGNGAGTDLIAMDTAFGGMPDAVWLSRALPKARIAARSNNREVQARLCALGRVLPVLPRPLGDVIPEIERIRLAATPLSATTATSNVWCGCAPCWKLVIARTGR
jgi:DNA-binding transcriptional LysR family regulator